MKRKVLLLIMCMTFLISLNGCDKKLKEEDYIGTWQTVYDYENNGNVDTITYTLEVYKGGAAKITNYSKLKDSEGGYNGSWELTAENEVLKVSYADMHISSTIGFEYNTEDGTLINQDTKDVLTKQ